MPEDIVVAIHELGFGGATAATLEQVRLFHEAGHRVTVLTFAPGVRTQDRLREAYAKAELPRDVAVRDLHTEYRDNPTRPPVRQQLRGLAGRLVRRVALLGSRRRDGHRGSSRTVEHLRGGRVLRTDVFDVQGRLAVRERHARDGSTVREVLWPDGHVSVRRRLRADGTVHHETYLTPRGVPYLRRGVTPDGGSRNLEVRPPARGARPEHPGGMPAWHTAWLQSVVDAYDRPPIVIGASQGVIARVARVRDGSAVRIGVFHNTHLEPPYDASAAVRATHARAFAASATLERIVGVSQAHAADIAARVPHPDRVVAIPNPVVSVPLPHVERDPALVVIVSRLVALKGIPDAVAAFARVRQTVPEARLEIYGRGAGRHHVERAIAAHDVGDSVHLMGRTASPREAMARALLTISTSRSETMGLSIAESGLQGTPVVAYDCLFGPAELISDGVTGRLVPVGDIDALADAVIDLLQSPEQTRQMGERARERLTPMLSPETAMARWEDLFAAARADAH